MKSLNHVKLLLEPLTFSHIRYYAMPLVELMQQSASTRTNVLTGMHEMAFGILMWSVEAQEVVYHHLKDKNRQG